MTQLDKIKKHIFEIEEPMKLAGCLDGIRFKAAVYCRENYPDEVIRENGRIKDITVYGMCKYLESEVRIEE